jgi:hypothetical protein
MTTIPTPDRRSDLIDDLKSLFAQAVPSNFLNMHSPFAKLLVGLAVGAGAWGLYRIVGGVMRGEPFVHYDVGFFFVLAVLPPLVAASLLEEERRP